MSSDKNNYNYVDPFWGNGGAALPPSENMACRWNWHKAQTGNTHPGALMPFGWVSVLPYSGGYPTGYGRNGCSSDGPPPEISDRKAAWGLSHFQPSGIGFIGYFYNYMLITPSILRADTSHISDLTNEFAEPGYYRGTLIDYGVDFELTADRFAALHRYHFCEDGAFITVDANNIGLLSASPKRYREVIEFMDFKAIEKNRWCGYIEANEYKIYFALQIDGGIVKSAIYNGQLEVMLNGREASSAIAFSTSGTADAVIRLNETLSRGFDTVRSNAKQCWSELLGRLRADFSTDEQKNIFYSNLYHSLVKPVDTGCGITDFQTMWDIYRTQLPLVLSISPEFGGKIVDTMIATMQKLGFFPNTVMMCGDLNLEEVQATSLVIYTLADAFFRGLLTKAEYPVLKTVFISQFDHADLNGKSPTHILDFAGALRAAAEVAKMCADDDFAAELSKRAEIWQTAYDPETGLMKTGEYYEGNLWNYSFRPHYQMQKRIALAGDKFESLLDRFFSIDHKQEKTFERLMLDDHFEGMNNESDMETPYCYLWAGRADRLAEICDAVRRYRFASGECGAPGNIDSGGLSSWYIWCCLGIYPYTGTNYYLLGSPSVNSAEIDFAKGTLKIEVVRESANSIYPCGYEFNGKKFAEPFIAIDKLEAGGTLKFYLQDAPGAKTPIPEGL